MLCQRSQSPNKCLKSNQLSKASEAGNLNISIHPSSRESNWNLCHRERYELKIKEHIQKERACTFYIHIYHPQLENKGGGRAQYECNFSFGGALTTRCIFSIAASIAIRERGGAALVSPRLWAGDLFAAGALLFWSINFDCFRHLKGRRGTKKITSLRMRGDMEST